MRPFLPRSLRLLMPHGHLSGGSAGLSRFLPTTVDRLLAHTPFSSTMHRETGTPGSDDDAQWIGSICVWRAASPLLG